ncbi:integrase family protein [Methylobacterium sp. GXF4]|uniref:tyrosine-type recombinase/integrase n=1 Tax=Methylobacterium sp. GXF4 TaxID=1096546 RepID=UPI000269A996|nr:tyrosine-type recombinase/integrase [Methylobacterium sp. GXF4]EIZ83172.1 integrase family protein [Methylobacterium sp. GXF4]
MPKSKQLHLRSERTRHGKLVWYVRVGHEPRIRIKEEYGTTEFWRAYRLAVEGAPKPVANPRNAKGTMAWLIAKFMASGEWKALAHKTRANHETQYRAAEKGVGHLPIKEIGRGSIMASRDARKDKPSAANQFITSMRVLFDWALAQHDVLPAGITVNPATGIKPFRRVNRQDGHLPWTEEEVAQYQAFWPVGTRQRVAMDVLLYTGLRRVDAVRLGRQHLHAGPDGHEFTIRTQKTGIVVTAPVLPALAATLVTGPTGDLAFIVRQNLMPYTLGSFGEWFKHACQAAGVPGRAHGLRKIGAAMAAEAGASESQLNALFGWADGSRESAVYVRSANRAKLARAARRNSEQNKPTGPAPVASESRT